MESARTNKILTLEDRNENATLRCNLEKMFLKPENLQESEDHDDDCSIVQTTNLKEEIGERIKINTKISMEELIDDIKTEVDKIIGDFSESTEVDPLTKQIEIERKRKIASELNDYLNSSMLKRLKADIQDSPVAATTKQKQMNLARPVVYTTRLDDMNIFRKKLKKLDRLFIWDEILRESKPVYSYIQQKTNLTQQTHINKYPNKLFNDINRINNKKTLKVSEENVEVIEISSPNTKSCLQSDEDNRKTVGKRKLKRKIKANDKINEQTIIDIDDEVIDLTDIDALNDKSVEEDIIPIDTMISNKLQGLSEKVINENNILSENLQTTTINGLKNINRIESPEEVDKIMSVESNKISESETFSREKRETLCQDAADTTQENLTRNLLFPVIYTTRLNDMLVLQNTVKYLDGIYVLKQILRESKPNIKFLRKQKNKANSVSKMSFRRLKIKLKILNRINKKKRKKSFGTETIDKFNVLRTEFFYQAINTTANTSLFLDLNNLGSKFFMCNPNTKIIEEVEVCRNIALIIHNKFSNQANMFLTNDSGKVTDFRNWTIGSSQNIEDLYKENDPTKKIIKLSTCCWFHTKTNIEKIWSNTATGIARFVQSIHKCLPGNCKCCCKPRRVPGSFKLKFDTSKEDENKKKISKKDKINSLIGRALDYRKPKLVKEKNKISKPELGQPFLIETNKGKKDQRGDALEYHAIDAKGNIDWQLALYRCGFHLLNDITRLKRLMGADTSELKYNEKNHDWLMCTLKAFDVPFYAIKYLKQTNKLEDSTVKSIPFREPELLQLVMDTPLIEHTRKCSEVKLIKIKDILNSNPVTKRGMTHEKYVDRVLPNNLLINPEPSTSGLSTYTPNVNTQTIQPIQPVQPTQPLLLIQPLQPIPPTQPSQLIEPIPPIQPILPLQPVQTLQPIQAQPPLQPIQPKLVFQPIQPKPPSQPIQPVLKISKRLIITCTEFPQMETVIDDVTPEVATQIIDEFKKISFQIKQGKLVATLRSLVKSTFTDEFQTLAKIVHLTQSKIRDRALFQDMNIQLNIRCEPMTSECGKATEIMVPEEAVTRVPKETIAQNVTQTGDTYTTHRIMEQFLQNKCEHFSRCCSFEKKSYKKSFESYIKNAEEIRAKTDNIVLPVISNVFSLTDSILTGLLNEAPKNDFNDSCSSFASSSSIVFNNDANTQTSQQALPVYPNYVQLVSGPNQMLQLSSKSIVDNATADSVNKNNTGEIYGTPKNDSSDSFASNSGVVVINSDANSQSSQQALPVCSNYVQMTSGQNQLLHLSSKTIVDNTIAAMVNKNKTQAPGPSNVDLEKLETLIPVNFIIDKNIFNDLMIDSSNNTGGNTRQTNNVILKSLLEKKTDIIFDNVLQKKK